jgi:hypothetical protein
MEEAGVVRGREERRCGGVPLPPHSHVPPPARVKERRHRPSSALSREMRREGGGIEIGKGWRSRAQGWKDGGAEPRGRKDGGRRSRAAGEEVATRDSQSQRRAEAAVIGGWGKKVRN